ncbi:MAG: bifunctional folylpolyglutamate synthase/dihydrofolate synthase [Opitutaceae bacterium]
MAVQLIAPSLTDYPAVRHYLYGLKHHGAKFGIDRMRLLAERLGQPHTRFPVVHVAGTNGKGSVAAMIESALRRAGRKTGLYTSPHLVHQGERLQVDRVPLTETQIVDYVRELQPIAAALGARDPDDHPSFFEFMTAMAFLHFERMHVDIAIVEVGLGGRLDATNVVGPAVSVITSISFDHTEILGETIEKIAMEKAGIIKPGRPVVIGRLPAAGEKVVRDIARKRHCELTSVADEFDTFDEMPETNLAGTFQRVNAATAALALRALEPRFVVSEAVRNAAFREVYWPGRWHLMALAARDFIFDAAHNSEGAACLEENLARFVHETGRRPHVVAGVLGSTRAAAIMATVARYARSIHAVAVPHQPRTCSPEELLAMIPRDYIGSVQPAKVDELFPAAGKSRVGEAGESVLVTGSIYLIGEVMDRLLNERRTAQSLLQD